MKKTAVFLSIMLMPVVLTAQAVIVFENKVHDFGKIKEEGGRVSSVFTFTNQGDEPLVISKVQASCGCTTPDWTKSPVEPGQKGTITVTYNPAGRPGNFSKSISVSSNASSERLMIKGEVIPKPDNAAKNKSYPYVAEGIALETKTIDFNNIEKGTAKSKEAKIKNTSDREISISLSGLPAYITAVVPAPVLAPEAESTLVFVFDTKKCSLWGPVADNIYLVLNNKKHTSDSHKITLNANVVEDFSKMTLDQKRNAPILEISKRTMQFGLVNSSVKQKGSFIVKNIGEKPLEIRRILNNDKEITLNQDRLSVRGGRTGEIKFSVDPKGLNPGKYKRAVTLQTNDPENVYIVLSIEWEIPEN